MALGLALVVKPLSIWLPLCYLIHGRWRALAMAGVTGAALALATLPVTGWEPWGHFLGVELPAMLPGTVRGTNIPLPSLHARMFVGREALGNGEPAPTLAIISALNGARTLLGLLLVGHLALRRSGTAAGRRRDWLLDASLGLTLTLLLAPMAWQHYASWLCIAFFVLALPGVWRPLGRGARVASGALAGERLLSPQPGGQPLAAPALAFGGTLAGRPGLLHRRAAVSRGCPGYHPLRRPPRSVNPFRPPWADRLCLLALVVATVLLVPQTVLLGKLPDHFDYWLQEYVHLAVLHRWLQAGSCPYGMASSWPARPTWPIRRRRRCTPLLPCPSWFSHRRSWPASASPCTTSWPGPLPTGTSAAWE